MDCTWEEIEEILEELVEAGELKKALRNGEVCYVTPDYLPETDYSQCRN